MNSHIFIPVLISLVSTLVGADSIPPNSPPNTIVISTYPIAMEFRGIDTAQKLTIAYSKLGYCTKFQRYPLRRSLMAASDGSVDGIIFKVRANSELFDTLVRVDHPIFHLNFIAFSAKPNLHISSMNELQPYTISYSIGFNALEELLSPYSKVATPGFENAFKMVAAGRVDLTIDDAVGGQEIIDRNKLTQVVPVSDVLFTIPSHHYLHKKHAKLAPLVSAVLKRMAEDPKYNKLDKINCQ